MEISDVKRRVVQTIERAKRRASDRRARNAEAEGAFQRLLDEDAVPIFRQVANVLKAQSYAFNIFTPGSAVRLSSDKSANDYIELSLDTGGNEPAVILHVKRTRGSRVLETELAIGNPLTMTPDDVLDALLNALEPFVER